MMIDRSAIQLAEANRVYAGTVLDIFERARNGAYAGAEDYAIHKAGTQHDGEDPTCWISTPSVPLYIEAACNEISAMPLTEFERSAVLTFTRMAANDMRKLLALPNENKTSISSLGNTQENVKSCLPKIEQFIKIWEVA